MTDSNEENKEVNNKNEIREDVALTEKELEGKEVKLLEDAVNNFKYHSDLANRNFKAHLAKVNTDLVSTIEKFKDNCDTADKGAKKITKSIDKLDPLINVLALLPHEVSKHGLDLPEKVIAAIDNHVPTIAKMITDAELEAIASIQAGAKKSVSYLNSEVEKSISNLNNKVNRTVSTLGKELDDFKKATKKEAGTIGNKRFSRFAITMVLSASLAAVVSGLTSYYVQTKMPHFVSFHGMKNVMVKDSKVTVFESVEAKSKRSYNKPRKK
jgi:hypothetical protein